MFVYFSLYRGEKSSTPLIVTKDVANKGTKSLRRILSMRQNSRNYNELFIHREKSLEKMAECFARNEMRF